MHDLGDNTRDHITLGTPHPAEHGIPTRDTETAITTNSHRWARNGALTAAAAILTPLITAIFADHLSHAVILLITVAAGCSGTIAAACLTAVMIERLQRPQRALIRAVITQNRHTTDAISEVAETLDRTRAVIADVIYSNHRISKQIGGLAHQLDDVNARLASLENAVEKVPEFAEGFSRGASVTATVLGLEKGQ